MKKRQQVGLVVEGNATASAILRLNSVAAELGPIKSTGLQVARRNSNFLQAGYGVASYRELDTADIVLLRLPDPAVQRVVKEICVSGLALTGMSFVLCESWLPVDVLEPLSQAGAKTATLVDSGASPADCMIIEGDPPAVRRIKRLLQRGGLRALELNVGAKPLLFAANLFLTAIPVPLFQLSQQALRDAGMGGGDLTILMREWSGLLAERVRHGGRGAWGGPLQQCGPQVASEYFERLESRYPETSGTLNNWLMLARRQMLGRAKSQSV